MKRSLLLSGVCLIAILALFMVADPNKVPSFVLMTPFVLLFIFLSSLVFAVLRGRGIPTARSVRVGVVLAAVPLILLVLQSIGQLTLRDVLTMAILLALSYFYISRSATSS